MTKQMQKAEPRWSRWIILAGAGLAVLIVAGLFVLLRGGDEETKSSPTLAPSGEGAPRLSVDQETLDFGDVQFETPIRAAFTVKNVGDSPLTLPQSPEVELLQGC